MIEENEIDLIECRIGIRQTIINKFCTKKTQLNSDTLRRR